MIGTTLGGIIIGVFATNGFTALGWELEWETLVAGALGLAGGWLAYKAATTQQRAIEKRNSFSFGVRTHDNRIDTTIYIEEILGTEDHGRIYALADQFVSEYSPIVEDILTGNDPLEAQLSQLVAKTSHYYLEAKETSGYAVRARTYREEKWHEAYVDMLNTPPPHRQQNLPEVNIEAEARDLKLHFQRLADCLYKIDDHFRFHHDIHPKSSS